MQDLPLGKTSDERLFAAACRLVAAWGVEDRARKAREEAQEEFDNLLSRSARQCPLAVGENVLLYEWCGSVQQVVVRPLQQLG